MELKIWINVLLLSATVCLFRVEGQIYEGKPTRNLRHRHYIVKTQNKRPASTPATEDYITSDTRRPAYIEGGNQWKPIYNIPTRPSLPKYRLKPNTYSAKYQQSNYIHPSEYYSKKSHPHSPSTINFVTNQTLLVSDLTGPSNLKLNPTYKKKGYHYVSQNNYNQQYEVHEDSHDDSPSYTKQTQYSYQSIPIINGKTTIPIKPSVQYSEVARPDTHFHHVHYHDTVEEAFKASNAKKLVKNYRRNPTSIRPH